MADIGPMIVIPIGGGAAAAQAPQQAQEPIGVQAAQPAYGQLGGSATTKVTGTHWDVDVGVDTD